MVSPRVVAALASLSERRRQIRTQTRSRLLGTLPDAFALLEQRLAENADYFFCILKQITYGTQALMLRVEGDQFYLVEQMPRGELLGSLEHIVLLALVRLGADAYGMTVRREIEKRTGRNVSIGAVYATLERLETKGYVSSFTGEPTAERGGRAKRLFQVEAAGERALVTSQDAIRRMTVGLKNRWRTT